jgi:putative ubiquitin-RnfH superfamily antitoxin RatB of RatAB toxin-antitoxin module
MKVEVAYARPDRQLIVPVETEGPVSVGRAIESSGILERFPEIDLNRNKVGVFGRLCRLEDMLHEGDRVEIYRPLIADPKQARRERARQDKPGD